MVSHMDKGIKRPRRIGLEVKFSAIDKTKAKQNKQKIWKPDHTLIKLQKDCL